MKKRKTIESLTPAEEAMIPDHIAEYRRLERLTGPADFETFEKSIGVLYKNLGLAAPTVVRAQSPKAVSLIAGIANALFDDTRTPTPDTGCAIVRAAVAALGTHVPTSMAEDVGAGVFEATGGRVKSGVTAEALRQSVNEAVNHAVYGQFWAAWPAFSTFCREKLGLDLGKKEAALEDAYCKAMMSVCWFIPHQNFVVAGERPSVLKLADNDQLHCVDGPALLFPDGFASYNVRGVEVPKEWILEKDKVDPGLAFTHPNMEQRRALVEILGWKKILARLPSRTLQRDDFGELFEVTLPGGTRPEKFVRVQCGTGREFCLAVAPETKTAHQGVADSYGLDITKYRPGART